MAPCPPDADGEHHRLIRLLSISPAVTYAARAADGGFRATFISANVERITGWPAADFLAPGFWFGHIHADDAARVRAEFTPAPSRSEWVSEYRFRYADGSWHWMRDEARRQDDEIVGSWIDVSDQRRAEDEARRQRDFSRTVIDSLPGLFCMIAEDGRLLLWNRNLELATGYGPDELAGKQALDFCSDEDREALGSRIAEVFADRTATEEATFVTKSGKRLPFLLTARRLPTPDGNRLVCTGIDITARRRTEMQLAHAARLATLGEMSASLTHEINQPLNVISLSAQAAALGVLRGSDEPKDTARRLNVILSQIDRINAITRHMALLSRRDLGRKAQFGFAEVMASAVELMRPQLAAEGIVLDHRPAPAGLTADGHPVRLEQVILNLLANAGHAVAERCRDLPPDLQDGRVSLRYRECGGGDTVEIIVADNGTGIPAEALPNLFEPFFTTKPPGKGTGLGLSVSRSIIEEMGGTLSARDTGRGAEFVIRLPLAPCRPRTPSECLPAAPVEGERPLTVLVVDDEEDGRVTTAECLAKLGCATTAICGGEAAQAACAERQFDLVLTDLRMPGVDGPALLRLLRQSHPGLPVAVMTGHLADPGLIEGAFALLRKPLTLADLAELVAKVRRLPSASPPAHDADRHHCPIS